MFCEEETNYAMTLPPSNAKKDTLLLLLLRLNWERTAAEKKVPLVRVCKQAYHCLSLRHSVEKPSIDTTLRHSEPGKRSPIHLVFCGAVASEIRGQSAASITAGEPMKLRCINMQQ